MTLTKNRTRAELIALGHCPICSKCTATLYEDNLEQVVIPRLCRKCGTLLLEIRWRKDTGDSTRFDDPVSRVEYIELTQEQWELWYKVRDWYKKRLEKLECQKWELEYIFKSEIPGAVKEILDYHAETDESHRLTLVKG